MRLQTSVMFIIFFLHTRRFTLASMSLSNTHIGIPVSRQISNKTSQTPSTSHDRAIYPEQIQWCWDPDSHEASFNMSANQRRRIWWLATRWAMGSNLLDALGPPNRRPSDWVVSVYFSSLVFTTRALFGEHLSSELVLDVETLQWILYPFLFCCVKWRESTTGR